jgi:hypothetical protein
MEFPAIGARLCDRKLRNIPRPVEFVAPEWNGRSRKGRIGTKLRHVDPRRGRVSIAVTAV